jgi:uncharacterized protein YyaL (SSP411 family)
MGHNRLSQEVSPYLLQHAGNPVNWWSWSEDAFAEAQRLDRPIFLSIGYAACHWCHVMEKESFENQTIADILNTHFVSIKVDREERPDVDAVYMNALHLLGEQGGWPLTMFLTSDRRPFWGGTYFPPESRYGRPGFAHVLTSLARLWRDEREKILTNAMALSQVLLDTSSEPPTPITIDTLCASVRAITAVCDFQRGGLKGSPKFPQFPLFQFLASARDLHADADTVVTGLLTALSLGGIYDHVGGGLARYSTDQSWLVPHFEKMLYDNAQFISLASREFLRTGSDLIKRRVADTVECLLADFRLPGGLMGSAFDADSEGEEGRYYVWHLDEIDHILGPKEGHHFADAYGATREGNFEGRNVLHLVDPANDGNHDPALALLLTARRQRTPPLFDDKALLDWNALAVIALAEAALVFKNTSWLSAAVQIHEQLNKSHHLGQTWRHSYRAGRTSGTATAEDMACLCAASLALLSATGEKHYLQQAEEQASYLLNNHQLPDGRLCLSAKGVSDLPFSVTSPQDSATPNAHGTAALTLIRLATLTGHQRWHDEAQRIIQACSHQALANPFVAPGILRASLSLNNPVELTLRTKRTVLDHPLIQASLRKVGLDAVIRLETSSDDDVIICQQQVCSPPLQSDSDIQSWQFAKRGSTAS